MRPVGEDERRFLERLANQAAIAVENARLQAGVRELAALEERERIARDLHDGIIQSIYATGLGLEECARLAEEQPGAVAKRLDEAIESLNTVIRDVRNYIVGLDPEELRRRSLGAALDDLARRLALNGLTSAEVSVEEPADRALTDEQAFQLFHICQEALANVVRHARATRVVVGLRRQDGHALLTVEDDGLGFEPGGCAGGRGLGNMAERARRLGGELTVASARGSGTRVTVRVPVGGPA
jgi:signal transduction histidine kinase